MTQPIRPSAGAYRAACQILDRQHLPGWSIKIYAQIIDLETGVAELLEAAKAAHTSLRTFSDHVPENEKQWVSSDDDALKTLEQAIAKCECGE